MQRYSKQTRQRAASEANSTMSKLAAHITVLQ